MNDDSNQPKSLTDILDRIQSIAEENDEISVEQAMNSIGRRSFGPLLLLVGMIAAAPGVGDIPGVATVLGICVLVVSLQLLFGRKDFWLPRWILERNAEGRKVKKVAESKWLRNPAKWIDRVVRERLEALTGPKATYAIAIICTVMALAMPLTEFVPLSTVLLSLGLVAFGISMISNDGLMALTGFALSAITMGGLILALL